MEARWASVPLGELAPIVRRPVQTEIGRDYPIIAARSFGRGTFHQPNLEGQKLTWHRLFQVSAGDLLVSNIKAWEGAVAVVGGADDGMFCSHRYLTCVADTRRVLPQWLGAYFKTPAAVVQLAGASPGSADRNRTLSMDGLRAVKIPLPPLDEQRRIVARIDEMRAKVEEATKLRSAAHEQAESLIVSTHIALSQTAAEPLANYFTLDEDAVPIELGEPYPQAGVRGFGGGLFGKPAVIGGQTTYRVFNRLFRGALVMSQVKGWEGAVAVTPDALTGFYVSPEYRTFRCKMDRSLPEYLAAIVPTEFFWARLKDATRGVGARRERTRPERFLQLEFSMPSISDQRRALSMFESIRSVQALQSETAATLGAMLPAILDKAFKGDL